MSTRHLSLRTMNSRLTRYLACFILALFSQEQTVLLYPPLLLGMVFWRGWRFLLRRAVWPAHLLILAALAVRYAIEILGQPGFFETIQAERPYVGLIFDMAATWPAHSLRLMNRLLEMTSSFF